MTEDRKDVLSVRGGFVRAIEDKILSGELKIGDRLPPARELCKLMGVSLTVVNTGVSELVSKGFLTVKPRHGTYVADYRRSGNMDALIAVMRYNGGNLGAYEIRSFCEVRLALDSFLAELVIDRAEDEQIKALEHYIIDMETEQDTDRLCALVVGFYCELFTLADNVVMSLLYSSTIEPQKEMYAMYVRKNGTDYLCENTRKVYESICSRDKLAARYYTVSSMRTAISGEKAII